GFRGGGGGGAGAAAEEEISPEDDQRANRTLFLGNLDITVSESDLRRAFDRFGVITEVDIKRPGRGQTSTYGFLKFENLDMAHRAKLAMSGKVLLRNPIKIGYGKATPTTRLWVGGLGPWVPLAALAREFDRFGTIRTIDYRKGDSWAYIQYESLDAAQAACTHMRNSNFPSNMHLLQGDLGVASSLLVEGATGGKVAQLKITQRLRLDQPKLDEVNRRIKVAGPNGYAILLAVPGASDNRSAAGAAEAATTSTQTPLRNLVSYLKQKQAAGVISLPVGGNKDKENSGVLHAFPPCDFSQQFLDSTAKALAKSEDDYLVMIIVRGAS
ncbi:RNA-binding protein 15, partial [Geospiza fortis]|uniref:RNA-binding protein 15 n=1 Tax=Geospiza fortis TaxID=48883 RepID=A0A8N5I1F1_GEOFO